MYYCPNCGNEATPGLNYCKRCGGGLNPSAAALEVRPAISPASTWAVGVTTLFLVVGGLAVLLGTLIALTQSGLPPRSVVTLGVLGFATIVLSVALLMHFWMRLLSLSPARPAGSALLKSPGSVNELGPARTGPFANPAPSVTENTTRTFEPSYREPQKR